MDKPRWRKFTDSQRLDWLIANCEVSGVSRQSIDDAIARDEFFAAKKQSLSQRGDE